jgi:hypothetical protein
MTRDSMLQHKLTYLNGPCDASEPSQILAALERMAKADTFLLKASAPGLTRMPPGDK